MKILLGAGISHLIVQLLFPDHFFILEIIKADEVGAARVVLDEAHYSGVLQAPVGRAVGECHIELHNCSGQGHTSSAQEVQQPLVLLDVEERAGHVLLPLDLSFAHF